MDSWGVLSFKFQKKALNSGIRRNDAVVKGKFCELRVVFYVLPNT